MSDFDVPADDGALERLLREQRLGPPGPDESTPWDFVRRWPDDVVRRRAWPIISRLLVDADETVRARAVEFVRDWSDGAAVTTPRLIEVAERNAAAFGDQRVEGVTLRHTLAHALANRAGGGQGPRVAAALKRLAANGPVGGGAASVLGEYEPAFVTAQVQRWGDGAADWLEEAARSLAMFQRDALLPFLQAVRALDAGNRQRIVAAVESYIKRDDAQAGALARAEGLHPPSRPAPSADECRRAAGL